MWYDDGKVEEKLAVGVCDAVAIADVCDEGYKSEKVPTEMVFAKAWSEICNGVKFEMAYESKKK